MVCPGLSRTGRNRNCTLGVLRPFCYTNSHRDAKETIKTNKNFEYITH